ncbi:MAG: hypothetical protein R6U37_05100 [Dehalococcoidia bacterium]
MKKIILEGCNTEWAQLHYLPTLLESVQEGKTELLAIGIEPEIRLGDPYIKKLWHVLAHSRSVRYINKNDRQHSDTSDITHVFVVTPDRYHSSVASYWLDHIDPRGNIFVEKPLDVSVLSALALKEKIEREQKRNTVFAFDHYLARAWPFLRLKRECLREIGELKSIDFSILESSSIPPHREQSLDKGIIFDLFCHILAIVGVLVEGDSTVPKLSFQRIKLDKVKVAQYVGCPICGETFALLDFTIGDLPVRAIMGKYVASDTKAMNICGSRGRIQLDFLKDEFEIFDSQDNRKEYGHLNPQHVEIFIKKAIKEIDVTLSDGILSFEAAFEILMILNQVKAQIQEMPLYQPLTPFDQIFKELGDKS